MTAIILAAGFSKRFGKEKLLMEIKNKPMILHIVDVVLSLGFAENILVYRNEEIKEIAANRNIKCAYNAMAAKGQSTSIRCGIRNSDPTDAYIFFTGDQPFINSEAVKRLISAFKEGKGSIIVPRYEGHNGNPVIFSSEWKQELEMISGDTGGRKIIRSHPGKVYYVDIADTKIGMDIDTIEQYNLFK